MDYIKLLVSWLVVGIAVAIGWKLGEAVYKLIVLPFRWAINSVRAEKHGNKNQHSKKEK